MNLSSDYFKFLLLIIFSFFLAFQTANAQKMDGIERDRLRSMLANIKNAIKKDYYDPNFHGIDIEARFKAAADRLDQVTTTGQGLAVIAQVLLDFNDSHLYFLPPATNVDVEYGWRMKMFGEKCLVTIVKPKSDAEAKGLKVGDQILEIESFSPNRQDLWKINYYFNIISKRPGLRLKVIGPRDEQARELIIESKLRQLPKVINRQILGDLFDTRGQTAADFNHFKYVGGITIWRMPTFSIDPQNIDLFIDKIKGSGLILDLRGNGGGYVVTLEKLAGFMFDRDLTIAELKGRKEMKPQKSKTRGEDVFKGKLIVLIDSDSGSAAEIFARLVQLEKRGTVIGDVSAGAVMQSRPVFLTTGANGEIGYGASITNADVIMSDGKSLERVGVMPDELLFPGGRDLFENRDPVLARAIQLLGGSITAEEAGKFFRYVWREDVKGNNFIEVEAK